MNNDIKEELGKLIKFLAPSHNALNEISVH